MFGNMFRRMRLPEGFTLCINKFTTILSRLPLTVSFRYKAKYTDYMFQRILTRAHAIFTILVFVFMSNFFRCCKFFIRHGLLSRAGTTEHVIAHVRGYQIGFSLMFYTCQLVLRTFSCAPNPCWYLLKIFLYSDICDVSH